MKRILTLIVLAALCAIPTFADDEAVSPLVVEKFVGYGGAWFTADAAPGITAPVGQDVTYRLVVKNISETDTLTGLTLTDSLYPLDDCTPPAELAAGQSFECVVGPVTAETAGEVTNVATATAIGADSTPLTATDSAVLTHVEATGEIVTIVGVIEVIDGNLVTVGGVVYTLPEGDAVLGLLEVGDNVIIIGVLAEDGTFTVFLITLADEDIYIDTDEDDGEDDDDFRDDAPCQASPPDWAPAYGWRMQCDPDSLENFILPPGQAKKLGRDDDDDGEIDTQADGGHGNGRGNKKDKKNNGNGNGNGNNNGNGNGNGGGNGNGKGNGKKK